MKLFKPLTEKEKLEILDVLDKYHVVSVIGTPVVLTPTHQPEVFQFMRVEIGAANLDEPMRYTMETQVIE